MTSFKFPPPPPPPPKAAANDNHSPYPSQRGGYGRGRGDASRGRGDTGRGGTNNFRGHGRGGQPQAHPGRGGAQSRGARGGQQSHREGGSSDRGGFMNVSKQWQQPTAPAPPYMSNVPNTPSVPITNPAFTTTPPVDPNAFVQAMSFMATPAGAHSMAAFASHMAHVAGAPYNQPSPSQSAQQSPRYSPSQQAGQKRKREERKPQQQGSKPPRARAAVPPPIPTFGFTLPNPTSVQSAPASTKNKTRNDRQGKVRLGLGSSLSQDESSSEDEDIDEEAALAARLKGGGYAFEHEGEQISLQTAGDVADWIKDRRRNFPTQQKALEKAHAAAIKRRNELEFVRKLKGKPTQLETRPEAPREKAKPPRVRERSEKDMKKQEELAALRKKLHESMMKKQQGSAAVDLGLGYGSETQSDEAEDEDEESSVLSDSSIVSSSEESSDDSEADSDGSDAAPEPISSKITPAAIKMPPPIAMQTPRMPDSEKMCRKFKQYGKCPFGHSCRFKHPVKEEKRTGLYEKLVEQELVRSDQLALDAIKYLGQNGFLG